MASSVEREIRNTLIDKLRALRPDSRIIHELNTAGTGSSRADVAAIGKEEILLFEIKSEKDVLKRLASQRAAFEPRSHKTFYVLDKKFFVEEPFISLDSKSIVMCPELTEIMGYGGIVRDHIWRYPEPHAKDYFRDHTWKINPKKSLFMTPAARPILNMLWHSELREVCIETSTPFKSRDTMSDLTERLVLGLTGRQVVQQVCKALRKREFAEADDVVLE